MAAAESWIFNEDPSAPDSNLHAPTTDCATFLDNDTTGSDWSGASVCGIDGLWRPKGVLPGGVPRYTSCCDTTGCPEGDGRPIDDPTCADYIASLGG